MTHLVAGALFVGFVAQVLYLASRAPTGAPGARRPESLLVLYVVGVTLLAALSQRDLWPFSAWRLMVGPAPSEIGGAAARLRIVLRTADGREYPLDHRAIEPIDLGELRGWLRQYAPSGPSETLDDVGAFVLERAEEARLEVRSGRRPGRFHIPLGPLAAPKHTLYPSLWVRSDDVPDVPFREVVIYQEEWGLERRWRDPSAFALQQVYVYRGRS